MGDSGEGLIDAEGRIQERLEEVQRERELKKGKIVLNPAVQRELDSMKLARTQLDNQFQAATHPGRKAQLTHALADIDRKIDDLTLRLSAK